MSLEFFFFDPLLASMQSSALPHRSAPLALVQFPEVHVSQSRAITVVSSLDFLRGSLLLLAKEVAASPLTRRGSPKKTGYEAHEGSARYS